MGTELIAAYPGKTTFNCPHCGALTHARWMDLYAANGGGLTTLPQKVKAAQTACCPSLLNVWIQVGNGDVQIFPLQISVPQPHPDMPTDIATDFQEARMVFRHSPRSSAALLRLCLEKLCTQLLGEKKKSIHDAIGALVAQGLPVEVQQALDATKIIGNNAIHVIELDIASNPDLALSLFGLINFIVDNRISQPAKIKALYTQLPAGALAAIERRDNPKP
ncbi:DUF4145 domain-containing protein [Pseudomonas aeruginosa]|uniref:DUF4145 domain-containing protein n=1 Tax=Pseudomonas aeruginosa TaxID=287 RepID=UPI00093AAE38|nr:DUF4145 domain-containing protein [Pseudomonas aeruginosa]